MHSAGCLLWGVVRIEEASAGRPKRAPFRRCEADPAVMPFCCNSAKAGTSRKRPVNRLLRRGRRSCREPPTSYVRRSVADSCSYRARVRSDERMSEIRIVSRSYRGHSAGPRFTRRFALGRHASSTNAHIDRWRPSRRTSHAVRVRERKRFGVGEVEEQA